MTPFVEGSGDEATITEIGEAIQLVLSDYPQFEEFKNKILMGIEDEAGHLLPDGSWKYSILLELLT